ncbi:MAG TPA: response regulator transcription factor [Bacteroidia bacterium]|nr:response regulator transcription factor [Bacteroidota bacterium]HRC32628.1 response regulator transcription factor [Bacteroidia bacterium]
MGKTLKKILLVEDDFNFGNVLKNYLELNDYNVTLSRDGSEGIDAFYKHKYDICLLDVMMPKKDGFTLAKEIRQQNANVPIIFLTAKSMKEDMVQGFQSGADDFITKPFDSDVLLLKIKVLLKRASESFIMNEENDFEIGKYHFDYKSRNVTLDGVSNQLSPKEAELLKMLCIHTNDIMPREKALKAIWGDDNYFTGRSMDVFITKLRKYLKEDPRVDILNIHGKGFRLQIQ